jgi:outer membrane protein OmpA-like peptidoglycan-associated protein
MRRSLLAALLVLLAPTVAAAQVPVDELSAQRFHPANGPGNYLAVESAEVGDHLVPSAGVILDYAHHPFTLFTATCADGDTTDCSVGSTRTRLVELAFHGHLQFALGLFDRVQVGLSLPLGYVQGDTFATRVGGEVIELTGGGAFVVGDPRLSLKVRALGDEDGGDGFSLGASVYATAPLGQLTAEGRFAGEATPVVGGHLIGGLRFQQVHLAANVGGIYRPEQTLFSTELGSMRTYSAGVGFDITPLLTVLGEIEGATSLGTQLDENPLEARFAGRLRQGDFSFTLGGGAGLVSGVGVPVFRVLGGLQWAPARSDVDGDGILDADDGCPSEPEDIDGYQDHDGCPDNDNDGDGLLDGDDRCPDAPEDRDGHEDEDGCPDLDNDGDGVPDGYDSCPNEREDVDGDRDDDGCPDDDRDRDGVPDADDHCPDEPEDTDGFEDLDGCPEEDVDGDGVPDDRDECPEEPETLNGFEDEDGCPEPDTDGDGIVDALDRCPNEPETLNGVQDDDGCPDGAALVEIRGEEIRLLQQVQFATNSARIRGRRSTLILDAVKTVLERNPHYRRVKVEGHTDSEGDDATNQQLSEARAQACVSYLVETGGIDAGRLYAVGLGEERPLESNATRGGREANRRVEFHIETGGATTSRTPAVHPSADPQSPAILPSPEPPSPALPSSTDPASTNPAQQ